MSKPIELIDHLLTYVHDLNAAASLFRRMGFTLSPISNIESMGISNHLVLMPSIKPGFANYIELMAARDRALLPPPMADILTDHEGIKSMVLGGSDAHAAHAAMVAQGFAAPPPVHVKREWVVAPGQSVFREFDVILPFPAPRTFNGCRYFNVDLYLRPDWTEHANSAWRISSVFAVTDTPDALADTFSRLFEQPKIREEQSTRVHAGMDLIALAPAAAKAQYGIETRTPLDGAAYLGYSIDVDSLDRLKAALRDGGVEHRVEGEAVFVDPAVAFGNLIVFRQVTRP